MGYIRPDNAPNIYNGMNAKIQGVDYRLSDEARYGEHIKNTAAICNSSSSHTYGSVISVIEKYLLDTFPNNLFKTNLISTTIASKQIRHLPSQIVKKEAPMMVLSPRISFGQGDNRFLGNTLINSNITNTQSTYSDGSLIPLAKDVSKGIYIHGQFRRALMNVDVVLQFDSYAQQVDYMEYIHNMLNVGHNKFLTTPLELYIPGDFCKLISHSSNTQMDIDGSAQMFLGYMNKIWEYPITYKLKGGSNSDEFFMYYLTDLDLVIQEPTAGNGIKNGQIKTAYDISFTVKCEFNTIGYYTLNAPDIKKPVTVNHSKHDTIVPIFTDTINIDDFELPVGWVVLSWPIFKLEPTKDRVSIQSILNQSLNVVIDYHLKFSIPMETFINIQFRENGMILGNEMFYIDWLNRELVVQTPNPRRTYRLIITVNAEYINNLIKEQYNLE